MTNKDTNIFPFFFKKSGFQHYHSGLSINKTLIPIERTDLKVNCVN